jgi:hypothetical protein
MNHGGSAPSKRRRCIPANWLDVLAAFPFGAAGEPGAPGAAGEAWPSAEAYGVTTRVRSAVCVKMRPGPMGRLIAVSRMV